MSNKSRSEVIRILKQHQVRATSALVQALTQALDNAFQEGQEAQTTMDALDSIIRKGQGFR